MINFDKTSPHLIEAKDLCLAYDGRMVLCEVDFSIDEGDYLCILGENGSGKSTLLKALLGLKAPTDGKIIYGAGLTQSLVGYLPQQTQIQKDFPASVREVVLSGCLGGGFFPFYRTEDKKKAQDAMEKMGISHLATRCYRELSGGQQQRVLLARALCAAGKILLLDEPVSGLDVGVTRDMYNIISEINRSGVTVVMVSHDLDAALKYSSRVLHLDHTVKFFGDTADYLKSSVFEHFSAGKGGEKND